MSKKNFQTPLKRTWEAIKTRSLKWQTVPIGGIIIRRGASPEHLLVSHALKPNRCISPSLLRRCLIRSHGSTVLQLTAHHHGVHEVETLTANVEGGVVSPEDAHSARSKCRVGLQFGKGSGVGAGFWIK